LDERKLQKQEDERAKKSFAQNSNSTSKTPDKVVNSHDMSNQYAKGQKCRKGKKKIKETRSTIMIMLMNPLKKQ
jgi:hypothetical protein